MNSYSILKINDFITDVQVSLSDQVDEILSKLKVEENIYYVSENNNLSCIVFEIDLDKYYDEFNTNYGIEIFKWFRIKGCLNHFVFISDEELIFWLKKENENTALFSNTGVSFCQKPSAYDALILSNIIENKEEFNSSIEKTIPFKKIQHEQANLWSLYINYFILNKLDSTIQPFSIPNKYLRLLETQELKYLYEKAFVYFSVKEEEKIDTLKEQIQKRNLNYLCIDDVKEWSRFYQEALGINNILSLYSNFDIVNIRSIIYKKNPDIIFIDLRLNNENGSVEPQDLSGVQILVELIKEFPQIPIVVTSASNNTQTIEYVKDKGVFAYWQKRSINNSFDYNNNNKGFIQLYEIVDNACCTVETLEKKEIFRANQRLKYEQIGADNRFQDYELIIIDTNFFMSKQIADVLIGLERIKNAFMYIPTIKCKLETDNNIYDVYNPVKYQIAITNECLSELLKHSKSIYNDNYLSESKPLTCQLSLEFIQNKLKEKQIIISNFYLKTSDQNAYADPYIIDFLLSNLTGQTYVIKKTQNKVKVYSRIDEEKQIRINTNLVINNNAADFKIQKIALLTGDKGLTEKVKRIQISQNECIDIYSVDKNGTFIKS